MSKDFPYLSFVSNKPFLTHFILSMDAASISAVIAGFLKFQENTNKNKKKKQIPAFLVSDISVIRFCSSFGDRINFSTDIQHSPKREQYYHFHCFYLCLPRKF